MREATLTELLGVEDVMARYQLRDRRSARRVMDEAGAFLVGGRLLVRSDELLAHEERLRRERHGAAQVVPRTASVRRGGAREPARRHASGALPEGWWRPE